MSLDMLVEGFTECKIRVPSFEGPIKGLWDPRTARGRERRAQGLADLGGPRRADGRRRAGGDFVGPGSSGTVTARF